MLSGIVRSKHQLDTPNSSTKKDSEPNFDKKITAADNFRSTIRRVWRVSEMNTASDESTACKKRLTSVTDPDNNIHTSRFLANIFKKNLHSTNNKWDHEINNFKINDSFCHHFESLVCSQADESTIQELLAFKALNVGIDVLESAVKELPIVINHTIKNLYHDRSSGFSKNFWRPPLIEKNISEKLGKIIEKFLCSENNHQKIELIDEILDQFKLIQIKMNMIIKTCKNHPKLLESLSEVYDNDDPKSSVFFQHSFFLCLYRRTLLPSTIAEPGHSIHVYFSNLNVIYSALKGFNSYECKKLAIPNPHIKILSALKHITTAKFRSSKINESDLNKAIHPESSDSHKISNPTDKNISVMDSIKDDADANQNHVNTAQQEPFYLLPEEMEAIYLFRYKMAFHEKYH